MSSGLTVLSEMLSADNLHPGDHQHNVNAVLVFLGDLCKENQPSVDIVLPTCLWTKTFRRIR